MDNTRYRTPFQDKRYKQKFPLKETFIIFVTYLKIIER